MNDARAIIENAVNDIITTMTEDGAYANDDMYNSGVVDMAGVLKNTLLEGVKAAHEDGEEDVFAYVNDYMNSLINALEQVEF